MLCKYFYFNNTIYFAHICSIRLELMYLSPKKKKKKKGDGYIRLSRTSSEQMHQSSMGKIYVVVKIPEASKFISQFVYNIKEKINVYRLNIKKEKTKRYTLFYISLGHKKKRKNQAICKFFFDCDMNL